MGSPPSTRSVADLFKLRSNTDTNTHDFISAFRIWGKLAVLGPRVGGTSLIFKIDPRCRCIMHKEVTNTGGVLGCGLSTQPKKEPSIQMCVLLYPWFFFPNRWIYKERDACKRL